MTNIHSEIIHVGIQPELKADTYYLRHLAYFG